MAKKKQTTDSGETAQSKAKPQFKGHHETFKNRGLTLIDAHRPRNAPHVIETWLAPDRSMKLAKVTDQGHIVTYTEDNQTEDADTAAGNIR